MDSLWGEEFKVDDCEFTKKILNKIKKEKKDSLSDLDVEKIVKRKSISNDEKLKLVENEVYRVLGQHINDTVVIYRRKELHDYLDNSLKDSYLAIDTETNNSLDPVTCKIMGLCLYSPSQKQAYVPINHINKDTDQRLEEQLTENDLHEELTWLMQNKGNCKFIFHNGKFDYEVIKCTCHVVLDIDWDTLIGAKLLDENEKSAGLKIQYITKINPEQEKYDIENLFEHLPYAIVSPKLFSLYAATDSRMTYELYMWQMNKFKNPDLKKIYKLACNLEMPLVHVIAEMELNGMLVDQDYAKRLQVKYHKQLEECDKQMDMELTKLKPKIDAWKLTPEANKHQITRQGKEGKSKAEQLVEPLNVSSTTQLAIIVYDILKAPIVNRDSPRSTGEDEIKEINSKMKLPFFDILLKRRMLTKLISTYVDAIPEIAKQWPDGRIRTHFNQYGAATGRLSSSQPVNFQNIPSGNKDIRLLFTAEKGNHIIGADFSAQEPRTTAHMSQDENMIKAYQEGKDLYSVIASMSFGRKYEDCLEFYPEGTRIEFEGKMITCGYKTHQNKEGKMYRTYAKSILLGITYGRGAASIAEQLGKTVQEAQEIIDKFFNAFPKVKQWIDSTHRHAKEKGYVEDVAGRRRRLPDILLPKYVIKDLSSNVDLNFNPFLECADRKMKNNAIEYYKNKLNRIRSRKEFYDLQKQAMQNHISIQSNTGLIAQAERQSVNAIIQGSAATLTKQALLTLYNDKKLRDLGAFLINTVHDEILMEVPIVNSAAAADRLKNLMIESAKEYIDDVPMSCDTYDVQSWYLDEYSVVIRKEFDHLLEDEKMKEEDAFEQECKQHPESTKSQIYDIVKGFLHFIPTLK